MNPPYYAIQLLIYDSRAVLLLFGSIVTRLQPHLHQHHKDTTHDNNKDTAISCRSTTTPQHATAQHSTAHDTRHTTHTTTTIMHPCCAPRSNKQPSFIHAFIMSKGRRLVIKKSFRAAAEQQRSRIHSRRSVSRLTSHDAQFNTGYIYTEKM